ncbi:F-box domain, Leucine-rich repeat domain, L domain-like protein [Artemisia annua]|uniref:F-box domain, Leucine-rich repeat domain, L domain-like protein n=1 Tax=Artemisia annua TaxID=35608 RepID=A0A2U1KRT2_ARTAN|nr:F-box domain, Leucine-rich repeat domain, L domain-like protein [Artemisia annua]
MIIIRKAFAEDDSSLFGRLPNEIILQTLTNLVDLKTLCFCRLVCRRFYWIVVEVDTISLTPSLKDNSEATFPKKLLKLMINGFKFNPFHLFRSVVAPASEPVRVAPSSDHKSFLSAIKSLERFKKLKSLCMVLPASFNSVDSGLLFKWKLRFHDRVDSFMFLSLDSVCDTNGIYGHGNVKRYGMLLGCTYEFPLLENVSIADNGKRGRITLNNEKVDDLRKRIHSSAETIEHKLKSIMEMRCNVNKEEAAYIEAMKSDTDDDFEDKEEAAYNEAMTEILKKHRGRMVNITVNHPI